MAAPGSSLNLTAGARFSFQPAIRRTFIPSRHSFEPVGADQPKVNAGSSTYPVDVSAALTSDGKFLTVAVVYPNESAEELNLSFKGITPGKGRMWRMTGDSLNAATGPGRNEVRIVERLLAETPKALTIAPISIDIYEFARQ
jgi:alpha-L-arabinofuranosidase